MFGPQTLLLDTDGYRAGCSDWTVGSTEPQVFFRWGRLGSASPGVRDYLILCKPFPNKSTYTYQIIIHKNKNLFGNKPIRSHSLRPNHPQEKFLGQVERGSYPHNLSLRRQVTRKVWWNFVKAVQDVATDSCKKVCLMDGWIGGVGVKWKEDGLQTAANRRVENVLECLLVLSFLIISLHDVLREVIWWYIRRGVLCYLLEGTVLCRHIHVHVQNIYSWKWHTAYKRFWVLLEWLTRGLNHNWRYTQTAKFSVALVFNSRNLFWHSQSHVLALRSAHTAGR